MIPRSGAKCRRANISVNPRVPRIDQWPGLGIAGQIATGHLAGQFALAELFDDRTTYALHLPEENVFSGDGTHLMDDGVTGEIAFGVGGTIAELTRELNITWFVDQVVVDRVTRLYWPENNSPLASG